MKSLALTAAALACAVSASAAITSTEAQRLSMAANVVRDLENAIPADYWARADCIVVVPEVKKAAFVVGGEYGKGVMSCRSGDGWSAPVFMQLAKGSWGFQAGAQQVDLVLLVMNQSGVEKLLQNKVTLGADASVAAGPLGRQAAAATDAQLHAEILSYSRAQGLFAGLDISGGVLRPDVDANANAYGSNALPRTILASRGLSAPPEATSFLQALAAGPMTANAAATRSASPSTSAGGPQDRSSAPAATTASNTSDLRSRIAAMQQMIDRMVSASRPTGTTGTSASVTDANATDTTVIVSRSQLMQLRQELDALMAAVDRR